MRSVLIAALVEFSLTEQPDVERFLHDFEVGNKLRVAFPNGSELPWDISLLNSEKALQYFTLCLKITYDAGVRGPSDTQPFGTISVQRDAAGGPSR